MFDSIRKHQKVLQFLLLVLIVPAFVFFGVSGYKGMDGGDDVVATVGDLKVTKQDFERAKGQQLQQMRQVMGEQFDPSILNTATARKEIIDNLVAQKALMADAMSKRITITDARLVQALEQSVQGLKKADGTFDKELYKSMLVRQGLTEAGFEAQARQELAMQTAPEAVVRSAFIPKTVIDRLVAMQEESREVAELSFKPSDFLAQVKPSPEQLKKYYDENTRNYETPESARIEYVVLSVDELSKTVTANADEVKSYYEQNKSKYGVAEQRKASHILISGEKDKKAAKEKAEGLLKQIKGGADFAALAKTNSDDPGSGKEGGDLGFFSRDMMVKPFSDAAFELKDGEISPVVESDFGFHIIKLTGIKAGGEKPFELVKSEIETEFKRQKAQKLFSESSEQFNNAVYEQPDSLKPVADKLKLSIQSSEGVTRQGLLPKTGEKPALINNAKLLKALFSDEAIKAKRNTESVEVSPGTLVSARIAEFKPAQKKPFEAVENDVRGAVLAAESRKLAQAAGEAKLKALKEKADGSGFAPSKLVSRGNAAGFNQQGLEAVYKASSTKLPSYAGADMGPAGYTIYQVTKVVAAELKKIEELRNAAGPQIAGLVGQQDLADMLDAVKARVPVKRNEIKLDPKAADASKAP